jgi:hypothetical protein
VSVSANDGATAGHSCNFKTFNLVLIFYKFWFFVFLNFDFKLIYFKFSFFTFLTAVILKHLIDFAFFY